MRAIPAILLALAAIGLSSPIGAKPPSSHPKAPATKKAAAKRTLVKKAAVKSAPVASEADGDRVDPMEAERKALPRPPSDEPKLYGAWLRKLPRAMRLRVMRFCRKNPTHYEASCGGIGPLHIPRPPALIPTSRSKALPGSPSPRTFGFKARAAWLASLSSAQTRYVNRMCEGDEAAMTELCGGTPLVIAFHNQPVRYTRTPGRFAFLPGDPLASDWPTAVTPWIARDLNRNGTIDSGAELFGSNTVLPNGSAASNGFVALAALDANRDGRIDAADPAFASLLLWADHDGDRKSSPSELTPLSSIVVSISLNYKVKPRCDARGNCERERSTIVWRDAGKLRRGSVIDIHLPLR